MRAAVAKPRFKGALKRRSALGLPHQRLAGAHAKGVPGLENPILYAVLFLVGYVPSVFYGRVLENDLAKQLASYYMNSSQLTTWPSSFLNQLAASVLQLLFTFLCGFSAFGVGFLILYFIFKGAFLGFCAVSVLTFGGVKPLVAYWSCVCLPSIFLLLLNLWLAGYAAQLSQNLLRGVFFGGAPRGRLEACARRLAVRTLVSVPISCLISILGGGIAILVSGFFS